MKKEEFLKLGLNYNSYTLTELGVVAGKNRTCVHLWLKSEGINKKKIFKTKRFPALKVDTKRKCCTCKLDKLLKDFPKNKNKVYGYDNKCKVCQNDYLKIYHKNRMKTDNVYKLMFNIRSRHRAFLKGRKKNIEDLGCSGEEFRNYIESKFTEGMNWDNYGKCTTCWSLDHIKPLSIVNFDDINELKSAIHFKNLQPMWHLENISKSNKYAPNIELL